MARGRGGRIGCLFNEEINKANLALQRPTVVRYRTPSPLTSVLLLPLLPRQIGFRPTLLSLFLPSLPRDVVNPTDTNLGAFLAFRHWKFCAHAMRSMGEEGANEELPRLAMKADGAVN